MKIGVISTGVFKAPPDGYSGLEMIAWQCAKGLAAKGHAVTLFAPEGSTCPGGEVFPIGPAGQWDERRSYDSSWQQYLGFDALIDHTWQKWAYTLKEEGRLKAPILGVLHAPIHTMYQSMPPVDKPCFVCISEDQRSHFEALHGRPARTAMNGIDIDWYRPLDLRRSNRFLFLARFSTIKSPDLAIETCREHGVGLDLVGDTSITNEPDYLAKCKAMCDGERIRMVGPCTRSEAVWWFSRSHALFHCCPNYREPLGLAPLESQACGAPVLCWNYGAMRETVRHGETGWIVSSKEELAVAMAAAKAGVNTTMRQRCVDWAASFSVQRMTERYEVLCVEAIETGGW